MSAPNYDRGNYPAGARGSRKLSSSARHLPRLGKLLLAVRVLPGSYPDWS
jgi:hypothetical protein